MFTPSPTKNSPQEKSQIALILSTIRPGIHSSDIEVLELCEASTSYPFRTVRSRINGARLCIEQNGKWKRPEYTLPMEATLASFPRMTKQAWEEREMSDTYPFA